MNFDKTVLAMAGLRLFFAFLMVVAALLMLYFNRVDYALRINAILGFIGPIVLVAVSALGIVGLAGYQIPLVKIIIAGLGVILILWGTS